jgi:hypothetical protein
LQGFPIQGTCEFNVLEAVQKQILPGKVTNIIEMHTFTATGTRPGCGPVSPCWVGVTTAVGRLSAFTVPVGCFIFPATEGSGTAFGSFAVSEEIKQVNDSQK